MKWFLQNGSKIYWEQALSWMLPMLNFRTLKTELQSVKVLTLKIQLSTTSSYPNPLFSDSFML